MNHADRLNHYIDRLPLTDAQRTELRRLIADYAAALALQLRQRVDT